MNKHVLIDRTQHPTDEVIYSHLGRTKTLWIALFSLISNEYPGFSQDWKYYNDGKCWLLKVSRKTKTVFWLSVLENTFRITFYFTDKANRVIKDSTISDVLKQQFIGGKKYNKIRGVTITFKAKKDVEDTRTLIEIKLGIK